jgi:signal transduction histidine kinase
MSDRDPKNLKSPKYSSAPPERVSQTKVVLGDEVGSSRGIQLAGVPTLWLDRLLIASTELPIADGEEAVVRAMIDALASVLSGYAVGACFVPSAEGATQIVVRRVPAADEARAVGADPARIFPGYAHERIFSLVGAAAGSTLHIAGDDATIEDDRAPAVHIAKRASSLLAGALERVRLEAEVACAKKALRALESHVIQADKLASFGEIAAGLVHELNNPLTSIVAYTDFLLKRLVTRGSASPGADPPQYGTVEGDDIERLRRISESANRMLRFTRDLVSYARPSSATPTPVVLHTAIDQAVAFCEHTLNEAKARVVKRYGADVLTVRGMPEQLAQVFVNLITNACHATPSGRGVVTISTEVAPSGKHVRIVVSDNGHGIEPEHLPHVFEPFFTTKGQARGTGLGLSIVKSIIEAHGGMIRAERGITKGARFIIRLPRGTSSP